MRFFYFILLLIVLVGCSSKKKLSIRTEQNTERFEQKDVQEHKTESRDSLRQKVSEVIQIQGWELEIETTTKTIIYDTSKPVDRLTGKPPIFQETEMTVKNKLANEVNMTHNSIENTNVSEQVNQVKRDSTISYLVKNDSSVVKEKTKKSFLVMPWLWIISGVFLSIIVSYCIRRRINPIRNIWKKLM